MNYHIVFDPELDVDAQGFADAWNDAPECRAVAEAQPIDLAPKGFPLDSQLVQQGLVLLSGMAGAAGGLAFEALKDVVKEKLTACLERKLARKPSIQVDWARQPGGAYLIVVTEADA